MDVEKAGSVRAVNREGAQRWMGVRRDVKGAQPAFRVGSLASMRWGKGCERWVGGGWRARAWSFRLGRLSSLVQTDPALGVWGFCAEARS